MFVAFMERDPVNPRATIVVTLTSVLVLALATVALQVRALGLPYLDQEQRARHDAVINGTSIDPWQYRLLSEFMVEGALRLARWVAPNAPSSITFVLFRVVQNILLLGVAAWYYRSLGFVPPAVLLGLGCLAWSLAGSLYDSDLQFNTYSDVFFYLLAGLVVVRGSGGMILPISLLAILNRETALLIPLLQLAPPLSRAPRPGTNRSFGPPFVTLVVMLVIHVAVRLHYGPHPVGLKAPAAGVDLVLYNLLRPQSYIFLAATLGVMPLVALLGMRRWPASLRGFFWIVVPAWTLVHLAGGVLAESRLFLVPQALVFIPGALSAVRRPMSVPQCMSPRSLVL